MSPCSVGEQDLGLAALTGKLFSHWELKGAGQGSASAAEMQRLPKVQCWDEAGIGDESLQPVTYRHVEMHRGFG